MKKALFTAAILTMAAIAACPAFAAASPAAPAPATSASKGVTFNFVDVELPAVAKFVSDITGKNFIFDERVRGKITIIAPTKLDPDDAFDLFSSVLLMKGFTLLPSGVDAYKIVPVAEARQSGFGVVEETVPVNENFIARLITLKYISSEEAMKFLKPVVSRNDHIASFGPGNMLLVVDSGLNMMKVLDIVEGIDQPPLSEEPEVVMLEHSSADAIAEIIDRGLSKKGTKPEDSAARAVADDRLNAVVLFGTKASKEAIRRLIALLDVVPRQAQSKINVYFLENADAEDLAEVLNNLLKGQQQQQQQSQQTRTRTRTAATTEQASPFESAMGISITPDKATNSLLVVSSPSDYQSLTEIIKKLDMRRRQVYVEAMIVEVTLDKLKELGARWRAAATHNGEPIVIGGVGTVDTSTIESILTGLSGLSVGGLGNYLTVPLSDGTELTVPGFAALFSFSEFKGVVNVLSSPQILTSDNTEAEILVGENVPFISQRESDATTDSTVLSSIERKDVGITLKLTPQVTEGDYVKLDLYQEISSVKETSETIGPTTTKRSTSTTVVVRDNQTFVIGGLMQESDETSEYKVPFISRIPVLGWLFKYKSNTKKKTNLLVFITPHVVKDSFDISNITGNVKERFARSENMYEPGELLVKFNRGVTEDKAIGIISETGSTFIERVEGPNHYRVRLAKGKGVDKGAEEYMARPEVIYAKPNYRMPETTSLAASAAPQKGGYAAGEVLVKFRPDVTQDEARALISRAGGTVLKHYEGLGLFLVGIPSGASVEDAVEAFKSMPEVEYSEPNFARSAD